MSGRYPPAEVRFWAAVDKGPGHGPEGDCWLWMRNLDSGGYGSFCAFGKTVTAHRFSYVLHYGKIPTASGHHGLSVCHRCDQRNCVNPNHLFLGTHAVNMSDSSNKGRQRKPVGEKSHRAKLTDEQVYAIRDDRRLLREIADDYDISESTASAVRNRKVWTHLPEHPTSKH